MTPADLEARAERVKAIAEGHGGRMLSRTGNVVRIEVPADLSPALSLLWGQGGYLAIYCGNRFECGIQSRTWNSYDICLTPLPAGQPAPGPAQITAPTPPPFNGA